LAKDDWAWGGRGSTDEFVAKTGSPGTRWERNGHTNKNNNEWQKRRKNAGTGGGKGG